MGGRNVKYQKRLGGLAASLFMLSMAGTALAADYDVTIVLNEEPSSLDPCEVASDHIGRVALGNIFEGLTSRDVATGEVLPALATGWKETDGNSWEFTIREGVKFHDGTDLTAASVKYAIDRTLNQNLTCESRTKFFGDDTYGVEIAGDNVIKITTPVRDPILPLKMSNVMIYPESVAFDDPVRTAPGTGPYALAEWASGQHIHLDVNPDYWGDKPSLKNGEYIWRSESSVRAAMVMQGEADFAPSIAVQDAKEGFAVGYPNAETVRLNLDSLLPPMDDIRVREAINLAIDRDAMLGTVLSSDATKATQLYLPSIAGWSDKVRMFEYDLDKAKALLAEARADGVPVDTEIQLAGRIGHFPNGQEFHEVVAIMLNELGLNVKLEWFEAPVKNKMQVKPFDPNRRPQIFVDQHDNTAGDPVFTVPGRWSTDGSQSKLSDAKLDGMIAAATAATGAERVAAWKAAAERIDELLPDAMMFHMVGFAAIGKDINYTPNMTTNSSIRLADITLN
jgi:peptide/nickel transport system substrate-binding protein